MCGFGGVLNHSRLVHSEEVLQAAASVSFRGPDSCGIRLMNEQFENVDEGTSAFFFNRLAILDLDPRSNQPFEDSRYLLLFNGEIYNYQELRQGLQTLGIIFTTTSDTEVLFRGLQQWGVDFLIKMNGMFAFFWLDKTEHRFLIGRDRLGIKPLYYKQENASFIFSSELQTILRFSTVDNRISHKAAEMYLWMQAVPTPYSIIDEIFKLPPGTYINGSIGQLRQLRTLQPQVYWDVYDVAARQPGTSETEIENTLKNSLERQLHADVPLGLFLSSGVDSSLLAALVNKYFVNGKDVNFFTVSYDEDTASDESKDAKNFIDGFKNPHLKNQLLEVNSSFLQDHLQDLYKYFDEPFGDSASLLNWVVSKKARDFVTVAISGDGADELFWGYPRYNRYQKFTRRNRAPVISDSVNRLAKFLPDSKFKYQLLPASESDPVQRHFDQFLPLGMRFLVKNSILKYPMWSLAGVEKILGRPDLPGMLDIKTYLADAMLYKVDRSSMASSLEVRVPYLDNEVIDYAVHLPFNFKSNQRFQNKAILKDLLLKLAPHYQVDRPKKGFNFPLRKWLLSKWKDQVLSDVTPNKLIDFGLEPSRYLKVIDDFYTKKLPHYEHDVWTLFNLMLWHNQYVTVSKQKIK